MSVHLQLAVWRYPGRLNWREVRADDFALGMLVREITATNCVSTTAHAINRIHDLHRPETRPSANIHSFLDRVSLCIRRSTSRGSIELNEPRSSPVEAPSEVYHRLRGSECGDCTAQSVPNADSWEYWATYFRSMDSFCF